MTDTVQLQYNGGGGGDCCQQLNMLSNVILSMGSEAQMHPVSRREKKFSHLHSTDITSNQAVGGIVGKYLSLSPSLVASARNVMTPG